MVGFGEAKRNTLTAEARKSAKTEEQREPEKRSKETLKYWAALKTHRGWWMQKTSAGRRQQGQVFVRGVQRALRTCVVVKRPEKRMW